jgi:8-oxo-dGTP pyrophosphatase MutT (NUDIX family)
MIEMREIHRVDELSVQGPVYLSVDLDCLDPAFAPGVSHHEPGGLSTREVLNIIHHLPGTLVGADIVEYNPDRDPQGITGMVAGKLLKEILGRMLAEKEREASLVASERRGLRQEEKTEHMIECISIYGNMVTVPRSQLSFRPAVYAIIEHDGKLLLIRSRHGGKYYLPGGGIELGERMEIALKRELREETGLEVEVQRCVHFQEEFFYYDPLDKAMHSFLFYYRCRPITTELLQDALVDDDDAEQPRWIDVQHLCAHDFQNHGEMILRLLPSCTSGPQEADYAMEAQQ